MNIRPSSDQIKKPDRPKLADIIGPGLITSAPADTIDPEPQNEPRLANVEHT